MHICEGHTTTEEGTMKVHEEYISPEGEEDA